jgi:hypothetical protein
MDIGAMDSDDEEIETISFAGLSIIQITPGMKERKINKVDKHEEYSEILEIVKNQEGNIDKRLKIEPDCIFIWNGRLYALKGFRRTIL